MFCTAVLNWKSNSYVVSEPTPPFPANISNKAPHTYIRPVPHYPGAPNLTLVASTSSLETHTLCTAADPDDHDPNAAPQFCAVLLNENTRAVLPNDDDLEHVPVGMALDLTSHDTLPPLTPDDPRRVPAAPIVWIMTDIGEVVGWHVYEMESARQRKAYEGMVEPVVKTVEDLDKLAGQAKAAGPPPPPPVPADKPVKIASASSTLAPASPPTPSPFAFTSSSVKAPEPGKPLFGAGAATTTKPFSAFSGAAGATTSGFGAFGAAKASDDKPSKPFSFGSGAPSLAAAAAATGAAAGSKSADTKPFAFGGASPALVAGEKPAFGFGAASPNAANLFAPKPAAQHPPAPPAKAEPAPGAFGFAPPTVSPPKFEAGSKRKAEEQQVSSAKDEDQPADDDDQQDEEQDGYESESESESEESEQEQATPPPPAAPAAPQTRPRLVQRFKIQSEDADSESSGRAPTTPARPSTSSTSVRGTPRVLQIPTFTPSKSASASGLASVTEMCTNMAGTLDLLRAKRRKSACASRTMSLSWMHGRTGRQMSRRQARQSRSGKPMWIQL
ncbi:hypothetical protein BCR44DRAFT_1103681 [Catenaria anguillulae PL171]|uniref:Nucleoporin Nup159/Nup146 N-terminal domain-containing protein n=1 Tax=Catenaria anguillulae PL171 TaxID=765915 RepID=A0A1Y2I2A3_9FUNG|nr:hypothetical protein BCR44DRAFT_1103681 [Catenaria anguillulae PL171]